MKHIKKYPSVDMERNTAIFDEYTNILRMENGWYPGNQRYNFKALMRLPEMADRNFEGTTVLDVGCGTGDFTLLLRKEGIADYVGIDIYRPYIEIARERYPSESFLLADFMSYKFDRTFDYAFCSGGMTLKMSVDNYDYLGTCVKKMWELTTEGVAFNVLIDDESEQDPDLFFYDPEKVLAVCMEIAPEAVIGAEKTPDVAQIHVYMYRETA